MPLHKKRKPAKRKPAKKKSHSKAKKSGRKKVVRRRVSVETTIGKKRRVRKKKRTVRRGQRIKVVHVVAGKKKRRRSRSVGTRRRSSSRRKPVVMAGRRRARSVGKKGNMGLLVALGVGALAVYFLTKPKTITYPNLSQLPPLNATNNYQRNDQQNSILQYALAASLGIDAITKLIQSLNSSSDDQIRSIYDHVETTGSLPNTVYV